MLIIDFIKRKISIKTKKKIKHKLKKVGGIIGYKIYKIFSFAKSSIGREKAEEVISSFQSVGYGVRLNGFNWHITSPEHLIIGNNVHIGDEAYFKTEGGLIIGDNTHISRRLTVYTENHDYNGRRLPYDHNSKKESVKIGKNVWVGMNVSILPGVDIGDGAIIGMGAVVSRNIERGEIVGLPKVKKLKKRNLEHYSKLNKERKFGGQDGKYTKVNNFFPSYLDIPSNKLCFVLSTGRCGSMSIAVNLNKHQHIYAKHEEIHQFIRLSTELAYNEKGIDSIKDEIKDIFKYKTLKEPHNFRSIIHSDQRFWNMVPILKDFFPESKFIHLIRNGRDTVRSMYARNWYADIDYEINQRQWAEFRLNGYKVGDVEKSVWDNWDSFEKCCWYWNFINELIWKTLDNKPSYLFKLEESDQNKDELLDFLGVNDDDFDFGIYNSANKKDKNKYDFQWTRKKEEIFQKIAGESQEKFYGSNV